MASGNYEYQSDFAKRYVAEGRAEGRAEGEAIGEAKGEAKGEARAILTILRARQVPMSELDSERILTCTDMALLDTWTRRAVTAATLEELFADG